MNENKLLDLCKHVVSYGTKKGTAAIETRAIFDSEIETEVQMAQISSVNKTTGSQIAIRVYLGKRMGSAFTNIPTNEAVEEAVELAIAAAKATTEDKDWVSLPKPSKYSKIDGIWDSSVESANSSEIVELTTELLEELTKNEPSIIPAFGSSGANYVYSAYANSNGVEHCEKISAGYTFVASIAKTETGVTPSIGSYDVKRGLNLDTRSVIKDNIEMIRICKNTAFGKTGKHPVIIHPGAYGQLFQYTLVPAISGENVTRGKSKIADKIGEQIAHKTITIYDDGTNPRGFRSSIADDEGVPRQKTKIIENGVLRSFIWDTYWANKSGVKSTGNAERNMRQGLLEISPSTITIKSGSRDISEIIKEIEHGYYIRDLQGAHSSNPESGDFSIVGNPAILIENGKLVGAVHGLMISGNIFDLLKNVKEVSSTERVLIRLIGPDIAFSDVDVIAKE
jgi:PmbA protein